MSSKVKVLFVCMGNICRSPTAEGVFRHLVHAEDLHSSIQTDSAGTHAFHVGEKPDGRAQQTAKNRGIDLSDLRARRVTERDFDEFDYVLAMDRDNYAILSQMCPEGKESRLSLFMEFAEDWQETEVPDPYYGGKLGFEKVFDMVDAAAKGLLADIQSRHLD